MRATVTAILAWTSLLLRTTAGKDYDSHDVDIESDEHKYQFAEPGNFPFVVFLTSKVGLCTGAILTEDWVITAARCVVDNREKKLKDQAVTVKAGIVNREITVPTMHEQTRTSKEIRVPDGFRLNNVAKYNVALIKVRDPFEFNKYVNKIEVSGKGWPQNKTKVQNCTSFGFGSYYTTSLESGQLKYWKVKAEHGELACPCLKRFQWKRLVCVKEETHPLLCEVDTGGPLVCQKKVVGVGHMVWDRNVCDDAVYPLRKCKDPNSNTEIKNGLTSFYFLCPLNSWIHKYVSSVPGTPGSCRAPRFTRGFLLAAAVSALSFYVFNSFITFIHLCH